MCEQKTCELDSRRDPYSPLYVRIECRGNPNARASRHPPEDSGMQDPYGPFTSHLGVDEGLDGSALSLYMSVENVTQTKSESWKFKSSKNIIKTLTNTHSICFG